MPMEKVSAAATYCGDHTAYLFPTCDSRAHAASRHGRVPFLEPLKLEEEEEEEEDTWKLGMITDLSFFADVDRYLDLDHAAVDGLVPAQRKPAVAELDFALAKDTSLSHSVYSTEAGVVPNGALIGDMSNAYAFVSSMSSNSTVHTDREARVMRYREKRKNRRFEKTVRYASRKAYAETRPRIKGRFAKRAETAIDGYGIVPSY